MKRLLSLSLICCILVLSLAAPAAATELTYYPEIEVLDYSFPNGGSGPAFTHTGGDISFDLPYSLPVSYVDVIFVAGTSLTFSSMAFKANGRSTDLTVIQLDDRTYRAFGSISLRISSSISFEFVDFSGSVFVEFLSVKLATYQKQEFLETGFFSVYTPVNGSSPYQYMEAPDTPIKYSFGTTGDNTDLYRNYIAYFYPSHFKGYDYFMFHIQARIQSITSISAYHGDIVLPFTYSYFDKGSETFVSKDTADSSTISIYPTSEILDLWITIDLRNIDRSNTTYPCVSIRGNFADPVVANLPFFELRNCQGFVENPTDDPMLFFTRKIYSRLDVGITNLGKKIDNVTSTVSAAISDMSTALASKISTLQSTLVSSLDSLESEVLAFKNSFISKIDAMQSALVDKMESVRKSIVNTLNGDSSSGNEFKDDSSGLISGLGDIGSTMDSVNRPSMGSINTNYSGDISDASILMTSLFSSVTGVDWVSRIILASVTIGLISYILYGKE